MGLSTERSEARRTLQNKAFTYDCSAELVDSMWIIFCWVRVIFWLREDGKRERNGVGSSAAHRAADRFQTQKPTEALRARQVHTGSRAGCPANPSPRASHPRHGLRLCEIEKAPGIQSTGWGQFVEKRPAPRGVVRWWKAPRVRRIVASFAGGRVRRPCGRVLRKRGSSAGA